ncbi:MAG: MerR family transcriptional regulator [Rhodosalinus sp.]
MNISNAAEAAGLPVKTVRYYADIGLVAPAGRTASGYRDYDDAAVRRLAFVRRAREFYGDRDRSSADVKAIARKRLEEIEAKQRALQALHDELSELVRACHGDDRPDCPILDHLG